jgi:hypothetical protein
MSIIIFINHYVNLDFAKLKCDELQDIYFIMAILKIY